MFFITDKLKVAATFAWNFYNDDGRDDSLKGSCKILIWMRKNIYISGSAAAVWERTETLIKVILSTKRFNVYYNDLSLKSNSKVKYKLFKLLSLPQRIINIAISDYVFFSAISINKEDYYIARILRKKIYSEFYISLFESKVSDWKHLEEEDILAKRLKSYDIMRLKSDKVIFLNHSEAKYYTEFLNYPINKYEVIPLIVEDKIPCKLNYFNDKNTVLNIAWWGTFIPLHGIEIIIEAIKNLVDTNINFHIFIFGRDDDRTMEFSQTITNLSLNKYVTVKKNISFGNGKLLPFLVENCDMALGIFGKYGKAKNVITNKVIDAVAMRIPIITGYSNGLLEYFNENESIYYTKNNANDLVKKIIEVSNLPIDEINERVEKGYSIYSSNFSYHAFRKNIIRLFE